MPCSVILTVSDLAGTPEVPAFSSDCSSLSTFVLSSHLHAQYRCQVSFRAAKSNSVTLRLEN